MEIDDRLMNLHFVSFSPSDDLIMATMELSAKWTLQISITTD